ncbi:hypothetical protein [Streptomyces sp. NPDC026659]|uniref:hypothetical protein n=1 Tax=Streptomyces sp. NPDC026659 TaxID=3155123 RepID=UPI0033C5DC68
MLSTTVPYRALPVLLPALLAGALLTGCSAGHDTASTSPSAPAPAPTSAQTIDSTPKVRDALAVLQATYNDGCTTPDNCEYFLTRVHDNLEDLDASMKADPQGKSHFATPLAWMDTLHGTLGKDVSFPNLEKHQKLLLGTRDKINTWMKSHPEDYR